MQMTTEVLAGDITRVIFDGRLDIAGAEAVDLKMSVLAGAGKSIVVDMQKVAFLGSMGLRTIVSTARAVKGRGAKFAMYGLSAEVERVLITSGISTMVPIHSDLQSAIASLQ